MIKVIRKIKNRVAQIISKRNNIETMFIDKSRFLEFLPTNPIIIDCGAHIGIDTIELAKIIGSKIYAFEAVEDVYAKLLINTSNISNISCFNLALNSYDGTADFFVSSGSSDGSSSLLKPKEHINDHPDVYFKKINKVACRKLDTWAAENDITKVDMLWLDMQGAEQQMLSASSKILETVKVIHSEVSIKETYEGVICYKGYRKFLKDRGFSVVVEAIPNGYDMGNVLFVRK